MLLAAILLLSCLPITASAAEGDFEFNPDTGEITFYNGTAKDLVIPDGVTSIGQDSFQDNKIESVVIPRSVKSIGSFAFMNNLLSEVTISADCEHGTESFDQRVIFKHYEGETGDPRELSFEVFCGDEQKDVGIVLGGGK